jgi:nitrate/nitrite transport system substrate-binding protein
LREKDLDPDPMAQFRKWFRLAKTAGCPWPTSMALSTCTRDGKPSVRLMLLKGADARGFVFYTNYESRKSKELDANPRAAIAITAAVIEAQRWCDNPANTLRMASIIGGRDWLKCPVTDIQDRLLGNFNFGDGRVVKNAPFKMKFFAANASFPWKSHELWFLTENQRWGKLPMSLNRMGLINKVNRSDIWRKAASAAGVPGGLIPKGESRGVEKFFDGKIFSPGNPNAYLASLGIKRV